MQEKRESAAAFPGEIDVKSRKNLLGFTRKRKRRQWGRKFGIPRSAGRRSRVKPPLVIVGRGLQG